MITFIEERISITVKFGWVMICYNLIAGLILFFTDFTIYTPIMTLITNGFWIYMFLHGFPFISITSFSLIGGLISTFISHFIWMYELLEYNKSGFFALCLYLTLIWGVPILVACSLFSHEESENGQSTNSNSATHPKSSLHEFIEKKLQIIKSFLPHSGDKLD